VELGGATDASSFKLVIFLSVIFRFHFSFEYFNQQTKNDPNKKYNIFHAFSFLSSSCRIPLIFPVGNIFNWMNVVSKNTRQSDPALPLKHTETR